MEVLILGTSSAKPTAKRNHPAVWVDLEGTQFLMDCGEGAQRQLIMAGKKATRIDYILLTHWHADHAAGLPPLLQSMSMNERKKPLTIIGPEGTRKNMEVIGKVFPYPKNFRINIVEACSVKPAIVLEHEGFEIWCANAKHGTPTISFTIKQKDKTKINTDYTAKFGLTKHKILGELQKGKDIEFNGKKILFRKATFTKPGKKLTYITDTSYLKTLEKLAEDSDLLVCEATYSTADFEDAETRGHMTSEQAGELARKAKVKQLLITHFSTRYKSKRELLEYAKKEFKNTVLAHDFLTLEV